MITFYAQKVRFSGPMLTTLLTLHFETKSWNSINGMRNWDVSKFYGDVSATINYHQPVNLEITICNKILTLH